MHNPYQSPSTSGTGNSNGQRKSRRGFRRDFWPVIAVLSGGIGGSAVGMQFVNTSRTYLFIFAFVGLIAGGFVFRIRMRVCKVDFAARRRVFVIVAVALTGPLLLCASGPQEQMKTIAYLAMSMSIGFSIGLLAAGGKRWETPITD